LADPSDVFVLPLEGKRRSTRRHAQIFQPREGRDEVFCDAVAEMLIFLVGTHIDERQDGQGWLACPLRLPRQRVWRGSLKRGQLGRHVPRRSRTLAAVDIQAIQNRAFDGRVEMDHKIGPRTRRRSSGRATRLLDRALLMDRLAREHFVEEQAK
jgi:hypothetical protein